MPSPPRLPRAGSACWLAASLCALLLPLACAQVATTAAGDKAALLEAKGAAETSACSYFSDSGPCPLNVSWTAATQPCGVGWEDTFRGWDGVECDASGGRVVKVESSSSASAWGASCCRSSGGSARCSSST